MRFLALLGLLGRLALPVGRMRAPARIWCAPARSLAAHPKPAWHPQINRRPDRPLAMHLYERFVIESCPIVHIRHHSQSLS